MDNFDYVIAFTLSLIDEGDMIGAERMMEGCNSPCNKEEFGHSVQVQQLINDLSFDGDTDELRTDIKYIKFVHGQQQLGYCMI